MKQKLNFLPNAEEPQSPAAQKAGVEFEPLLTSREAAGLLRVHPKTLERWARQRRVPGYFFSDRWFFRASELDGWLRSTIHSGGKSGTVGSQNAGGTTRE